MHVVVTGGGTGGHIFPALEIAKEFQNQNIKVTFVGNKNSLEQSMAKSHSIDFFGLNTLSFVGKSLFGQFRTLFFLQIAIINSIYFILKNNIKIIVGVGGYVSFPMIIAGFLCRKKCFICEQNVSPGLANKVLSKLVSRIFISFMASKKYFANKNTVFVGNPVREDFFGIKKEFLSKDISILVTGGSLGAKIFNEEIPKAISIVNKNLPLLPINITHQTGKNNQNITKKLYDKYHIKSEVIEFINYMPGEFVKHDLIISRAGATVCAEICASGMPAILVPYRYANGHQRDNAKSLVENNAALMLEEGPEFHNSLALMIINLYKEPAQLKEISLNAKKLAMPKAALAIVTNILS
jgi:UDP-N-acetylglucosamine--N-acetylmuramyl-(pentapeptide) pyrophosphoryl-undecaprenol N-acetylglucosamine transferase